MTTGRTERYMLQTATNLEVWTGMWKWVAASVISRARRAISKKAVQACGLETSP